MPKNVKAEKALTDARTFPSESCRERLSRRYGQDAVALSGPDEGKPLADAVCRQLERRWEDISGRFASDDKVHRLAIKLARSFGKADDTADCVRDLVALGYHKEAARGIAGHLKAYAMDDAMEMEMAQLMDEVEEEEDPLSEDPEDLPGEDPMGEEMNEIIDEPGDAGVPDMDPIGETEEIPAEELPGEDAGETVTIELPMDVVQDLAESLSQQVADLEVAEDAIETSVTEELADELPGDLGGELPGDMGGDMVEMDLGIEEIPGESAELQEPGEQIVTTETEEAAHSYGEGSKEEEKGMGMGCACGPKETEKAGPMMDEAEERPLTKTEHEAEETEEEEVLDDVKDELEDLERHEEKEEKQYKSDESDESDDDKDKKEEREAAFKMRAGRLRKVGENLLKIGPEMSINNTDQQGGHDGMQLGNASDKDVEKPKPLPESNIKPEGYMANGTKVQDGSTLKNEEAFDPKEISESEVSGGESSLLGQDESYPTNTPEVPAGSSPIRGEEWGGGNVSTKGTVIATVMPNGILIEAPDGKKTVPASIKSVSKGLVDGIGKIKYEGSVDKFASAVQSLLKKAMDEEGVTKTDTSKLEAEKFTNDEEKEAEDDTSKGHGGSSGSEDGIVKTDTSKLEAEKFTNDGEKAPEKDAASGKAQKTAGEKQVKDPRPVQDNMKPEGHMAGGQTVQDGSTIKNEDKFDPEEIEKSEVSKGEASLMGKDEELPKDKANVPVGDGQMGEEEFKGDNVETKGTTIANSELAKFKSEAKVREARLKTASIYAADLLRNGLITPEEYPQVLEDTAKMPVQAIQQLISSTRAMREKVSARSAPKKEEKSAAIGMRVPVVVAASNTESSLAERLTKEFKLTKTLDEYEKLKTEK